MKTILVLAMALVATIANADTSKVRQDEKACLDKTSSNGGMLDCTLKAEKTANDLLVDTKYDIDRYLTMNKGPEIKEYTIRYKTSQHAWESYREADCKMEGIAMMGGTGEDLLVHNCKVEQTLKRVDQLIELQKVW